MYTPSFFRFHSISETYNVKNLHWTSLERCVHLAALRCWWHHPITPLLPPQPLHVNLLLDLPKTHSQHFQICNCEVRCSLMAVTPVLLKIFANEGETITISEESLCRKSGRHGGERETAGESGEALCQAVRWEGWNNLLTSWLRKQ